MSSVAAKQSCATFARAAAHAASIGLGVNAGHDLDLVNLPLFRQIKQVQEVSIGHALIADALRIGLAAAVAAYIGVLAIMTTSITSQIVGWNAVRAGCLAGITAAPSASQ